ncbi:hypothetical protein HBB16_17715 [Pseudonocardia sp. MCCB 268]|nr:hypothetical protein [Pseudonocardia cytotoxica]
MTDTYAAGTASRPHSSTEPLRPGGGQAATSPRPGRRLHDRAPTACSSTCRCSPPGHRRHLRRPTPSSHGGDHRPANALPETRGVVADWDDRDEQLPGAHLHPGACRSPPRCSPAAPGWTKAGRVTVPDMGEAGSARVRGQPGGDRRGGGPLRQLRRR